MRSIAEANIVVCVLPPLGAKFDQGGNVHGEAVVYRGEASLACRSGRVGFTAFEETNPIQSVWKKQTHLRLQKHSKKRSQFQLARGHLLRIRCSIARLVAQEFNLQLLMKGGFKIFSMT
jgi:hypothetical protein